MHLAHCRKPGLVAMINNMSAQMDKGNYLFDFSDYGQDVHTVASLLKKFLKDLPDALLPDNFYHKFVACARLPEEETRLSVLKDLVFQLPTAHYHTLRFIMRHLGKVVAHSKENKVKSCSVTFDLHILFESRLFVRSHSYNCGPVYM